MLKSYKKGSKLFLVAALLLLIGVVTQPIVLFAEIDTGFTTQRYEVKVDVQENNSMLITETIRVDFKEPRHGIFRYIPKKGTAIYKHDNKVVELDRAMIIDKISVEDYEFETSSENGNAVIKIGDPDATITGKHTYQISYRCRLYEDGLKDYDLFYFNVLPTKWTTDIEKAAISVNLPKDFDSKDLQVIVGQEGTNEDTGLVDYSVQGNSIRIESKKTLPQGTGITVFQELPQGYFVGAMTTDWAYFPILIIALLIGMLLFLLWFLFGRDPKIIKTVEFNPPNDASPMELEFVLSEESLSTEGLISMLFYFADKGYLAIEEKGDKRFILHKLKEYPKEQPDFECAVFEWLFKNAKTTDEETSIVLSKALKGFDKLKTKATTKLQKQYKKGSERQLFTTAGSRARVLGVLFVATPMSVGLFFAGIFSRAWSGSLGTAFIVTSVLYVILLFLFGFWVTMYSMRHTMSKTTRVIVNVIFISIIAVIMLIAGGFLWFWAGFLAFVIVICSTVVSFICTRQMKKLTPFGASLFGKILGFKHFIEVAEVKKLNLLVEENPSYFYNILPYAYAMGLSDKWASNFKQIPIEQPDWYRTDRHRDNFNSWVFMHSVHSVTKYSESIVSATSSSGGGSSFGGGSSGGTSGGGFGGGGGGSW